MFGGGLAALFGGTRKRKMKSAKKPRSTRKTSKVKRVRKVRKVRTGTRKGMRRKSARRSGLRLAYDFAKPRHY